MLTEPVIIAITALVSTALGVMGTLITSRGATSAQAAQEWRELHNSNLQKIARLEGQIVALRAQFDAVQAAQAAITGRLQKIDAATGQFVGEMAGVLNATIGRQQGVDNAMDMLMKFAQRIVILTDTGAAND